MSDLEIIDRAETFEPEEPTPLLREIPPGEAYPMHALGPLRQAAEAIHDKTQAPAAIGAQSVLGVAALAVQGLFDAETLHGWAPPSLFLLTIAQSGDRKTTCDKLAMAPVRDFEKELGELSRDEQTQYQNEMAVWEAERKRILAPPRKSDGPRDKTEMQVDLAAIGPEPKPPLYATITAGEPTLEGVVKHMALLRPALGLFSDEGGAFVGGHGMNSENRLKTVAGLSVLWDGTPVDRWRAGDGVAVYHGRRLSAHLMAQPVAAAGLLADPIANGQGFLARFLITEPPSAIGTRLRVGHSPESEAALSAFKARAGELLRRPLPLADGTRNELEPPLLPLSGDAREVLQEFALVVEAAQAKGGELEGVRPFASKAAEHAARLAAVMTLFGNPDASNVTRVTMDDAVTLATFYVNEAARLTDAATISKDTADAEKLRRWILESWGEQLISTPDVVQRGPNQFRETAHVRKLLAILQRHGWLVLLDKSAEILNKRRREAWSIVRGAA
jgi:hypothetical protein